MEYLMSYGWAILLITMVGVALLRMGVLNVGDSNAPTSTGFDLIKPLLPQAEAGQDVPATNRNGFSLYFVNLAGEPIRFISPWITVDGKTCEYTYGSSGSKFILRQCLNQDCTSAMSSSNFQPTDAQVPPDGQIKIQTYTVNLGTDPCSTMAPGGSYNVGVDITYEIDVGGVKRTQHSQGNIRITPAK